MSVRRLAVAAALALALVLPAAGCGADDSGSGASGGTTVSASGYELQLPSGWTRADEGTTAKIDSAADPAIDDAVGKGAGAQLNATEIFFRGDAGGAFRTNVNVILQPLQGDDFDRSVQAGARLVAQQLPEGKIDSGPDKTTLDGEPAYELRYSAAQQGVDLRFVAIQALHDDTVYSLTLTSDGDNFGEAEPEFEQIVDSWHWS